MTWITTLAAPDLTSLFLPVISNYSLNITFTGRGGSNDPQVRSFVNSYILACDKALRSYNAGRRHLLDYTASENRTSLLHEGHAEFETCVTTVKRCLRLVEKMRANSENPDISRTQWRLLESFGREINDVRNAIEHMDEDIRTGGSAGVPAVLHVSQDGTLLRIGGRELLLSRLVECLRELHTLSMALASRDRG